MKKILALLTVLFVLSACGGGGRPSTDEIADALNDNSDFGQLTKDASDDAIDCFAKVLHDSDLSDEALQALVDGDKDFDTSKKDQKAVTDITDDLAKCLTG
jgi:hypothetical protein